MIRLERRPGPHQAGRNCDCGAFWFIDGATGEPSFRGFPRPDGGSDVHCTEGCYTLSADDLGDLEGSAP